MEGSAENSVDAAAASVEQQAEAVARAFVDHYYNLFDSSRPALAALYHHTSMLSFEGQRARGAEEIARRLAALPFDLCRHHVSTVDCQPSPAAPEGPLLRPAASSSPSEVKRSSPSEVKRSSPSCPHWFLTGRAMSQGYSAMSKNSSSHSTNARDDVPQCHCKRACKMYISSQEWSKGRRFYRCARWKEESTCDYFEWAGDVHLSTADLRYQLLNMEYLVDSKLTALEKKLDKLQDIELKVEKLEAKLVSRGLGAANLLEDARKICFYVVLVVAMYLVIYFV